MTMTKQGNISSLLVGLLVAAVCLASCVKIQTLPDQGSQEIALRSLPVTKADAYPDGGVFGVFAYKVPESGGSGAYAGWIPVGADQYLYNAAFMNRADKGYAEGWDLSTVTGSHKPYYWPDTGSLLFAGYSPHADASGGTITQVDFNPNAADRNPYMSVKFAHKVTDTGTYKKADLTKMPDFMWFDVRDANSGNTASSGTVNLNFRRALSMVSLTFSGSASWYKLKDVRLTGCIYSGTFYSGITAGWLDDVNDVADYVLLDSSGGVTLNGWKSQDLLMIPQYLDGIFPALGGTVESGIDVKLVFTVTDGFGSQTVEIILKDHTQRWEMGKHYKYNVAVNADPIVFGAPSVSITTQTVTM